MDWYTFCLPIFKNNNLRGTFLLIFEVDFFCEMVIEKKVKYSIVAVFKIAHRFHVALL